MGQGKLNSLAPGRFKWNFYKLMWEIDGWGIWCEISLGWLPLDHTCNKSTMVQVTAWCRQATSHYLSQCWPRSMSPYGVTRPQWLKNKSYLFLWCHVKIIFGFAYISDRDLNDYRFANINTMMIDGLTVFICFQFTFELKSIKSCHFSQKPSQASA